MNVEGELLWLSKVTRSEMGAYLCIASNGVPPSVSKRMKLQVHCKCCTCSQMHASAYNHVIAFAESHSPNRTRSMNDDTVDKLPIVYGIYIFRNICRWI